MSNRITEKDLAAVCGRLNRITGSPETYMTNGKINIGHYHISHAYGGVCLHQTVSAGGGVRTPLMGGHVPKRELYDQMMAYIYGIESAKS